MGIQIFAGMPPKKINDWIVEHYVPPTPPVPTSPVLTLVKQQNPDLPEDVIDFGGPIVATGENLQMGDGDTLKIELYEGGEPVDVLDRLGAIVSTPTAISFTCSNTSHHPDGEWMGKDVLLTVTIGGVSATRWLKFRDDS